MELLTKASRSGEVSEREKRNLQVAYEAACEGIVLLKNDGTLPFSSKRVALYGPGASMTIKGGTGSGEVNERHSVTVWEGMENRGFEIASRRWLKDYEEAYPVAEKAHKAEKWKRINLLKLDTIMEMLFDDFQLPVGQPITEEDVAESATDSCVYVVSRQAGEGGDRKVTPGDYQLTEEEKKAIRFCAEHYEKFVLVINCGSSMDMSFLEEIPGINAVLYMCQLGTEGGHAVADVLSGQVNPSGKLSDTWAKHYEDIPFGEEYSYRNGDLAEEYYREGIYVGYRYFDRFGVKPAYPFGFGLSYTEFTLEAFGLAATGSRVTLQVKVTNTGNRPGKEVVQLYVSTPEGDLPKEYQSLAAFEKTEELQPGQSTQLELTFDLKTLASYWEAEGRFILDAGSYLLRLGNSSRNTETVGAVKLEQPVIVSRHDHVCPVQKDFEELTALPQHQETYEGALQITVEPSAFETVNYTYETPAACVEERVRTFVDGLTLKEQVEIVVGIGMFGGKKRFQLPGAVGNTTSRFWDRGLANVALCDGPAGLRIQKRSTLEKNGKIKPVEMAMSIFDAIPGFIKKFMVGDPEKRPVLYQYTTAFPVANALAQTWNKGLMYQVGTAVYQEMKEYGCTYWLAPAVNIHRNPLCGRNFEYFSEDPRLSGEMAAAITRGVQQEEGYYVTVKHYACNNQEDNRNRVSSNVSERALREIYLRPFEITVREANAKSIMTSYNKVNGVYAPNSYDLCTKVLRNEWGFEGVVMTDWFSTNPGMADNALCMAAGNDLLMPGGSSFKRKLRSGVRSGKISEEQVRRCCENVVQAIINSSTQREYIKK